jgi:hypothetical protein
LELYEQALPITREVGDRAGEATTLNNMAVIYYQRGEVDQTVKILQQVVEIYRAVGQVAAEAAVLQNLAVVVNEALHDTAGAVHYAEQAIALLLKYDLSHDAGGTSLADHQAFLEELRSGPAAPRDDSAADRLTGVMQAIRDFVNAESWAASRQVVEVQRELLVSDEVEQIFNQNIAQAESAGEEQTVRILQMHRDLLRRCREIGIEAAFAELQAAVDAEPVSEADVELPFPADLPVQTVSALLGGPEEKMAHAGMVARLMGEAGEDAETRAFYNAIQTALFGGDLRSLGSQLDGVYRQAWAAIVAAVETEGAGLESLNRMAGNTVAVFGPAADRRGEWLGELDRVATQAQVEGRPRLAALAAAFAALVRANGDAAGLGQELTGIQAELWEVVVAQMMGGAQLMGGARLAGGEEPG